MSTFAKPTFNAVAYAASRPSYPPALYAHILSLFPAPVTTLVDIGCGPGLSTFPFATSSSASSELKVLGVDPGAGMVQTAKDLTKERGLEGKVKFVQGGAETLGQVLSEGEKVDGVVAGQAAHWFDAPKVYNELRKVLKPGGGFAFWGYGEAFLPHDPELSALIGPYSAGTLGPYWQQPGRSIVESLLAPFPLPSVDASSTTSTLPEWDPSTFTRGYFLRSPTASPPTSNPSDHSASRTIVDSDPSASLLLRHQWTLEQFEAYLRTWSSAHTYDEKHPGEDVVTDMVRKLKEKGWQEGEQGRKEVSWEVGVVSGRLRA